MGKSQDCWTKHCVRVDTGVLDLDCMCWMRDFQSERGIFLKQGAKIHIFIAVEA
jgi:hypothetical protein